MPEQMKTPAQNKAIFGLGAKMKCAHEDLRELAFDVTRGRTDSIKQLTFDEANGVIKRLGGRPFTKEFKPRRTEQYHRQEAGVKKLVTAAHLDHLTILARECGMTQEGLESLCKRMIKVKKPRTSSECNKVIEAIKAMNARDRTFGGFKKQEKEAA